MPKMTQDQRYRRPVRLGRNIEDQKMIYLSLLDDSDKTSTFMKVRFDNAIETNFATYCNLQKMAWDGLIHYHPVFRTPDDPQPSHQQLQIAKSLNIQVLDESVTGLVWAITDLDSVKDVPLDASAYARRYAQANESLINSMAGLTAYLEDATQDYYRMNTHEETVRPSHRTDNLLARH